MSQDWDFYFCQVEGMPASLFVDLGIRENVPVAGATEFAWLRVRLNHPRPDGLSADAEFDRLAEIEDALEAVDCGDDTELHYVGRNTCGGCRDFYFYTSNPHQAQTCLSAAMVTFDEYEFETGTRPDPEWSAYLEFLYPSERDRQMILNGRVLQNLEEHGDRHKIQREVTHWAYFNSNDDRARFVAGAEQRGYELLGQSQSEAGRFGTRISRVDAIDYNSINAVVLELFDLAQQCNGEYDGWETSVETGEG